MAAATTASAAVQGPENLLVDVEAVAAMLGVSTRSVWRLSDAARMPRPVRLGTSVRWKRDEVAGWIGAGCPRPAAATGRR